MIDIQAVVAEIDLLREEIDRLREALIEERAQRIEWISIDGGDMAFDEAARATWEHHEPCPKCGARMDPVALGSFETLDLYDPWPLWSCNRCGNVIRKRIQ